MPTFWGVEAPGIQKPGGVSWWAALNYAFKLQMTMGIGMAPIAKSVGAFGLSLGGTHIGMDGHGTSNASFNLGMNLSMGFTRPTPLLSSFALALGGTQMNFTAAERYSRSFGLGMNLSVGFAPAGKSVSSFGLNLGGTQVNMAGVFVPLDPQYISGTSAETTSMALSAHATDDYILMWAFRDGATTAITVPAGWTVAAGGAGTSCYCVLAWRKATSNAEVSGTWTGATGLVSTVYRNIMGVGNAAATQGSSATVNYGPFTFGDVDPSYRPWVASFGAHRSTNANMGIAPTGQVNRVNLAGATQDMAAHDTNGPYASTGWPSTNVVTTETSSGYLSASVELIPMNANIFENVDLSNVLVPLGKSAKVTMRGPGAGGGGTSRPSSGGWGGGGAGGGAWVKEVIVPPANLGTVFSCVRGTPGVGGQGTSSSTAAQDGTDATDTVFTSGATTITAGGGKKGSTNTTPGNSAGGLGGTYNIPAGLTFTEAENGTAGTAGRRATGANTLTVTPTTHAGPGGGGGGSNSSSGYAGAPGGSSADTTGGAAGQPTGGNGVTPTDPGAPNAGGGGGGGAGGSGSTAGGLGGNGTQGGGGGGAGGKEGSISGAGNDGGNGGIPYNRVEFV